MRSVILLSHNNYAQALLQAAFDFTLTKDHCYACSEKDLEKTIEKDNSDELVVLAESWNSLALEKALPILEKVKKPVLCLAGMNLNMVIAAISFKNDTDTLSELQLTLDNQAKSGIKTILEKRINL